MSKVLAFTTHTRLHGIYDQRKDFEVYDVRANVIGKYWHAAPETHEVRVVERSHDLCKSERG